MSTPNVLVAGPASALLDPEAIAYFSAKQREKWRRHAARTRLCSA
jgi:hypothetical protein